VKSVSVELRPGESQDSILRRFRKAVSEARILPIVRQKRWFTSKSEIRRIKRQKAIRKVQRTMMEQQQ
jgi:small subunit ribosomal protein S21